MNLYGYQFIREQDLTHYGIKGQRRGVRRFQNEDGSLTAAGKNRYQVGLGLIKAATSSIQPSSKQEATKKPLTREIDTRISSATLTPSQKEAVKNLQSNSRSISSNKENGTKKSLTREIQAPAISSVNLPQDNISSAKISPQSTATKEVEQKLTKERLEVPVSSVTLTPTQKEMINKRLARGWKTPIRRYDKRKNGS